MPIVLALTVLAANAPVSIGISGVKGVQLPDTEVSFYSELLGQRLRARGAKVVTARELGELLGAERQKQLLGECGESCIQEIVQAMGTELLLFGDFAHVGAAYTVSLRIVSAGKVKPVAQYTVQVADADAMPFELDRAARELLVQTYAALGRSDLDPGPLPSRGFSRKWAAVPAGVGVAGMVVGAVSLAQANSQLTRLRIAPTASEALEARDAGSFNQTLGWVAVGVGAAAFLAAVAVLALGGEPELQASVAVSGSGGGIVLTGRWP